MQREILRCWVRSLQPSHKIETHPNYKTEFVRFSFSVTSLECLTSRMTAHVTEGAANFV
jgi:hypothetical protein